MDAHEIALLFATEDPEKIKIGIEAIENEREDTTDALREALAHFARQADALATPDALPRLRQTLLWLAHWHEKESLVDLLCLLQQPYFATAIPEKDWLRRELHRILASLATRVDVSKFGDLVLNADLPLFVREQALLAIHFMWLETEVSDVETVELYRVLLEQGLDAEDSGQLWMALVVNAAMVGGVELKPQVMSVLDSGRLGDQTKFVRKVVNGLFGAGNLQIRDMLLKQHKGFYADMQAEIIAMEQPADDESEINMPGRGKPLLRETPKIGRNDPCPCGSGKKYKKCCGGVS
jgi:hypothetical protein